MVTFVKDYQIALFTVMHFTVLLESPTCTLYECCCLSICSIKQLIVECLHIEKYFIKQYTEANLTSFVELRINTSYISYIFSICSTFEHYFLILPQTHENNHTAGSYSKMKSVYCWTKIAVAAGPAVALTHVVQIQSIQAEIKEQSVWWE